MSKRNYKKNLKKQNEVIFGTDKQSLTQSVQCPTPVQAPAGQTDFFIQYIDKEYLVNDIIEKIKEKCKTDGTEISDADKLSVYLKPEDQKAYYTYSDMSGFIEL